MSKLSILPAVLALTPTTQAQREGPVPTQALVNVDAESKPPADASVLTVAVNDPNGFVAAVDYVTNYFDSLFTNPVTIHIDVGYGEIDGAPLARTDLGESEVPVYVQESYGSVVSALQSEGAPGSSTLPGSSPLSGNLTMNPAEAQALGLRSAASTSFVGFSSTANFSYALNSTPPWGQYYFVGIVEHEFTEDIEQFCVDR